LTTKRWEPQASVVTEKRRTFGAAAERNDGRSVLRTSSEPVSFVVLCVQILEIAVEYLGLFW
jgi:hypothetical protein